MLLRDSSSLPADCRRSQCTAMTDPYPSERVVVALVAVGFVILTLIVALGALGVLPVMLL